MLTGDESRKGLPARLLDDAQLRRELIFAVTIAVTIVAAPGTMRKVLVAVILTLALGLYALLVRGPARTAPGALLLCSAGGIAAMLLAPSGVAEWPVLLAAVHTRTAFKGDVGLAVTGVLAVVFGGIVGLISHSLVGVIAGIGVPVLATRRLEQLELESERDRAVRLLAELEAARDAQAQAAALEERGRIAREMHDVLAHSLAGLSLQLQAVRAVAAREGVSPIVMEPIDRAAELARTGVDEAKAVVGALRSPAGARSLGIPDLPTLLGRFPGTAELAVDGRPQPVSESADHAIYRAVQESLTNAARYAPGSTVRVAVHWESAQVRVLIIDDGPGEGGAATALRPRQRAGAARHGRTNCRRRWAAGGRPAGCRLEDRDRGAGGARVTVKVLVADDQAVVRDGLALLLSTAADIEVVAVASDGAEAVELALRERPDVALLDLRMPNLDGVGATTALAEQAPGIRVLILTTYADDEAVLPALRAGAAGYLTKDTTGEALFAAIREVAAGRTVLDAAVQARLVALLREPAVAAPVGEPALEELTPREVDVVRLVAQGLSNRQIARQLFVGEATVKTHLNHVLSKLDVEGRPGLVAWAWRHGLAGQ